MGIDFNLYSADRSHYQSWRYCAPSWMSSNEEAEATTPLDDEGCRPVQAWLAMTKACFDKGGVEELEKMVGPLRGRSVPTLDDIAIDSPEEALCRVTCRFEHEYQEVHAFLWLRVVNYMWSQYPIFMEIYREARNIGPGGSVRIG